jgi:hypothetical protein
MTIPEESIARRRLWLGEWSLKGRDSDHDPSKSFRKKNEKQKGHR